MSIITGGAATGGAGAGTGGGTVDPAGAAGGGTGGAGTGGAGTGGDSGAAAAAAAATAGAGTGTGTNGAGTGGAGAGTGAAGVDPAKTTEISWPKDGFMPDWHERTLAALGDVPDLDKTKALEKLKRAGTPADLFKSTLEAEKTISRLNAERQGMIKVPGKDAKPEEIAAYHKAIGVPETVEAYKPFRPQGVQFTEADTAREKEYLARMHKAGVPEAAVNAALEFHYAETAKVQQEFERNATRIASDNLNALKGKYGDNFQPMLNLTNRLVDGLLGSKAEGLMNTRLATGETFGENAAITEMLFALAAKFSDDGPLISSGVPAGMDIDKRISEIEAMVGTPRYNDEAIQAEYDRLLTIQSARKK